MKRIKKIFVKFYNCGILPFAIFLFAYNLHYADNLIKFFATSIYYPLFFALLFFLYGIIKLVIINLLSYKNITLVLYYKNTNSINISSNTSPDFNWENIKKITWFQELNFLFKSQAKNEEEIIKSCKIMLEKKYEDAELLAIILDSKVIYEN